MRQALSAAVLFSMAACSRVPNATVPHDGGPNPCEGQPMGVTCFGTEAATCDGMGNTVSRTDCAASSRICAPTLGCRACVPSRVRCEGETVERCNADGTVETAGATCDPTIGQHCSPGGCVDLCADSLADHSYIGCDYFATITPNSELDPRFRYAIVIANPQLVSAEVTILHGTDVIAQIVVPAGSLEVHELDWIDALRGDPTTPASVQVADGAYHVVSDVPITITQFNPLRYQSNPGCMSTDPADGCFSYTNDASLLLPTHVLTGSYLTVARATHVLDVTDTTTGTNHSEAPGFVAIVNVEDHAISVTVRSTAHTLASLDGTIPALAPGEVHDFGLEAGDVLVLESAGPGNGHPCPGATDEDSRGTVHVAYCDPGDDYDLTGTEIATADHVAVFAGHDCTFVPYNRWACDHLEQQIFPVESLGNDLFVPITHPLRAGEPNLLRVVAAGEAVHVTFDPPLDDGTTSVDLVRGEFTEHEIRADVWVHADGPILGALFLVGQAYLGFDTIGASPFAVGDPAMSLVVPTAQYRRSYEFLAPDTYSQSYVGIAISTGGQVFLDDAPITSQLSTSGATMMSTGQLRIPTGPHAIRADRQFGVYVYGFGSYTSYMVPGGMDFVHISAPL